MIFYFSTRNTLLSVTAGGKDKYMKAVMKKLTAVSLAALMAASAAVVSASAAEVKLPEKQSSSVKIDRVEGEAVVALKKSAGTEFTVKSKASSVYGSGIKLKNTFSFKKGSGELRYCVVKSSTLSTEELIESLNKNPKVKYAFANSKKKITALTNDTYSNLQWHLENTGQNGGTAGEDIKVKSLWEKAESSDEEKVVAIVDTGVDYKHKELKKVMWENPYGNKLLGNCGCDFTGSNPDGNPMDDYGHGTHVAGIIAASSGNKEGISGINKKNVKIMAIKSFDSTGSGDDESIFAAFEYIQRAVELGTKVCAVNCSFGSYGDKESMKAYDEIFNALGEKGVVFCVAACNESENLNDQNDPDSDDYLDGYCTVPACSSSPYCITVALSDENGDLSPYSNYGDKYVDIAAPGTNILSTVSYNCFNPAIYTDEQRSKLCSYYQSYDGEFESGDFGYPVLLEEFNTDVKLNKNVTFEQGEKYFGLSGKSLKISVEAKRPNKTSYYAFEIPFKIEDESKNYRLSFEGNGDESTLAYVFDVPADYDTAEDIDSETTGWLIGTGGGNDWFHFDLSVDTKDENYDKSKERKLVFLVGTKGEFNIDDLAVSNQSAEEEDFGKYDFMSGTSMATPMVTGSVALVAQAYPDANAKEIANIVKSSGKVSPKFENKTKNAKALTLDTTEKVPPMISSVSYNNDGNVKIEGLFKEVTKVYADGEEVSVISKDADSIIIKDNGYNTHIISLKVENKNGFDTYEALLTNKTTLEKAKCVEGAPYDTSSLIAVPAGNKAYFVDSITGAVGMLETVTATKKYVYTDEMFIMDMKSLIKNESFTITSAVYSNGKIYFILRNDIKTKSSYYTLGYDTYFCCYDLAKMKAEKLCEVPDECAEGASLGVLKGKFYLIGGFIKQKVELIDSVYSYDSSKKTFSKTAKLPEGRAYSSFIEYGGKLVGFWGAVKSGELPKAVVFDGKAWKKSSLKLESSDFESEKYSDDFTLKLYSGNVGLDKNGVFCLGSFVEDYGDIFTYDVANDKIIENGYCYRNDLSAQRLIGTTVQGGFIGFNINIEEYYYDDELYAASNSPDSDSYPYNPDDPYGEESSVNAYFVELNNASHYPKVNAPSISRTSLSLKAGASSKLTVSNSSVLSWGSSNESVAEVNGGKVTALKKGKAEIYAVLSNGSFLTCKVNVTSDPSIKVNGAKFNKSKTYPVKAGKKLKVNISGKAPGFNNVYSTTNKSVAKAVSKKTAKTVYIKGYKKGSATVTLKVNGVKFNIKVKVK